jgi:cytochrome c6
MIQGKCAPIFKEKPGSSPIISPLTTAGEFDMVTENKRMRCLLAAAAFGFAAFSVAGSAATAATTANGEDGFKLHCAACHADGGNIIKADKTLSRQDREKHGIKTANDIVKLMRKPGEGMTTFDKKTVSDKEARAIANYIIKTFK